MLGIAIGKGRGGHEHDLLDPFECAHQSVIVEIVALTDLDTLGDEIGRLGGIAGQAGEITGGPALQEVFQGHSADIAGGAGDEDLGHGVPSG